MTALLNDADQRLDNMDDYYTASEDMFEHTEKEQCDGCGLIRRCQHLEGFGRDRILCKTCLDNIFGEGSDQ